MARVQHLFAFSHNSRSAVKRLERSHKDEQVRFSRQGKYDGQRRKALQIRADRMSRILRLYNLFCCSLRFPQLVVDVGWQRNSYSRVLCYSHRRTGYAIGARLGLQSSKLPHTSPMRTEKKHRRIKPMFFFFSFSRRQSITS